MWKEEKISTIDDDFDEGLRALYQQEMTDFRQGQWEKIPPS